MKDRSPPREDGSVAGAPRASAPAFLDPAVLSLLRCPVTRVPLESRLVDGRPALVTTDGSRMYPVLDGVPVLLPEAGSPPPKRTS